MNLHYFISHYWEERGGGRERLKTVRQRCNQWRNGRVSLCQVTGAPESWGPRQNNRKSNHLNTRISSKKLNIISKYFHNIINLSLAELPIILRFIVLNIAQFKTITKGL